MCLSQYISLDIPEMISIGPLGLLLVAVERLTDTLALRLVSEGEGPLKHGENLLISALSSNRRGPNCKTLDGILRIVLDAHRRSIGVLQRCSR